MNRTLFVCLMWLVAPVVAHADDIPIVTLGESGPDQEIPTNRSFYVAGEADAMVEHAQAVIVRRGSPSMFGDDGPSCRDVFADLQVDVITKTAADDDDDDGDDDELGVIGGIRYEPGVHRAFELFPRATGAARTAQVLVTASWERRDSEARTFKVFVPHDRDMFAQGYGYCLFVLTTEHAQELADDTISEVIEGVARKIVACGDQASCDDEALSDYEGRATTLLGRSRTVGPNRSRALASRLREAARVELGAAAGIVEALDHMRDRWHDKTNVMTPTAASVWADVTTDPLAQAIATLLARSGALLPQVRTVGKSTAVALFTPDGKLQVRAIQLLDDGRSLRVASTTAPEGDQARVLTATTDTLVIADGLTLYDLIQLGQRRIRIEKEWVTLKALGDRMSTLGLESWSADDSAVLAAATVHMTKLADFVDLTTTGLACTPHTKAELLAPQWDEIDTIRRHLGEWLVCQRADAAALETMREQLASLGREEAAWNATIDKLVARSRRIVTLTTTAPTTMRVSFRSPTWVFSYVTPIVGYAGVLRPDETFGLFYLGAQIHLDPNPVGDVLWRNGVTTHDLRRSIALELGVAPYGDSFGPDMRYSGPGSLPPLFAGAAIHLLPYTSVTFGASFLDRRRSTLLEEEPHIVVTPYVSFTIQLNVPDLLRSAVGPSSHTEAAP